MTYSMICNVCTILGLILAESNETQVLPVTFHLDRSDADHVSVAGSFNNWDPDIDNMNRENDSWFITLELTPGYYYYKFVVDGIWIPDPENTLRINDGGDGFNSILKVGTPPRPVRHEYDAALPLEKVPQPVIEDGEDLVDLYRAAWLMALAKVAQGTAENGFVSRYMDEGFNELIFQWDTCFMAMFGIYGGPEIPAMASLDNFYKKQRPDGYIQRVYHESDGTPVSEPTIEEPLVNPPLFSWVEWEYYRRTGDTGRFRRVLPVLTRYFEWLKTHLEASAYPGLYYMSELGSGMDNTPRSDVGRGGWIDMSAQQALNALCLSRIADTIGERDVYQRFYEEYEAIKASINSYLWNPETRFYHDLSQNGGLSATKHIGAFWTLIAEVATPDRASELIKHLLDPDEFWRMHLIPTLAADEPEYSPRGHYWRGGVWAPTNYMVLQGLKKYGKNVLSRKIALNHVGMMSHIFEDPEIREDEIAYEERYGDGYHTIWECYAPDSAKPATRWDDTFLSRQDFVGWSGLGPIAMLIEDIIGLDVIGAENRVRWYVFRTDTHGVRNLNFRNQILDLICSPQDDILQISVNCNESFILEIVWGETRRELNVKPGKTEYTINK